MNTLLSENGTNLSGGEKQRISLCRFLPYEYDVIIADEITSNIDEKRSYDLYKQLIKNSENKIIFIISHDQLHKKYCNKHIYCKIESKN